MPHISSKKIDKRILEKLYKNLGSTISKISSSNLGQDFISTLMTHTERIMFAKRITIIWLLYRGVSYEEIENKLKVSPMTVAKFAHKLDGGKYDKFIDLLKKEEKSLFNEIYDILHLNGLLRPYGVRKSISRKKK